MSEGPTATPTPTGPPPYRYRGVAGCGCPRCRIRGLRTPFLLITIGGLFLLDRTFQLIRFGHLWPVILIVIGIVMLLESTASTEGHRG
ncbi:MAG: LiaI-LiaF-like domain-containing protein [Candidatus Acidiferrales bacterium]